MSLFLFPQFLLHPLEQHRIGRNRNGAGAHRQRSHFWCEQDTEGIKHTCRDGNGDQVVDGCPEQVLLHLGDGGLGETDGRQHIQRVTAHQNDFSRLNRDARPRANGYPEVCLCQCWRIIDPVAYHRGEQPLALELLHIVRLVRGLHLGKHAVNAQLATDSLCCATIISGQHPRPGRPPGRSSPPASPFSPRPAVWPVLLVRQALRGYCALPAVSASRPAWCCRQPPPALPLQQSLETDYRATAPARDPSLPLPWRLPGDARSPLPPLPPLAAAGIRPAPPVCPLRKQRDWSPPARPR